MSPVEPVPCSPGPCGPSSRAHGPDPEPAQGRRLHQIRNIAIRELPMPTHDDAAPLDVRELPESVDEEFAGSDWEEGPAPPSGDPGDGRTLFDTPRSEDGSVLVVFPQEKFPAWRSQALAHIDSGDGRTYLAQVAAGPYAAPN